MLLLKVLVSIGKTQHYKVLPSGKMKINKRVLLNFLWKQRVLSKIQVFSFVWKGICSRIVLHLFILQCNTGFCGAKCKRWGVTVRTGNNHIGLFKHWSDMWGGKHLQVLEFICFRGGKWKDTLEKDFSLKAKKDFPLKAKLPGFLSHWFKQIFF